MAGGREIRFWGFFDDESNINKLIDRCKSFCDFELKFLFLTGSTGTDKIPSLDF